MPVENQNHCLICNKSLAGKRSHAVTCSSTCRGIQWRANKEPVIKVQLHLSEKLYNRILADADTNGVSISWWMVRQSIGADVAAGRVPR